MSMDKIQADLKAPKGQFNGFGKYKYRSCEDIVEAVKPVLAGYKYWLNMSDEVVLIGERVYVKATCSVMSGKDVIAWSTGLAREALSKKGMDESQITGAASSYARKYALNGLFAIDDTKDADSSEQHEQVKNAPIEKPVANKLVIAQIQEAQTLEELQSIWKSTPNQPLYESVKNEVKTRLMEVAK